MVGLMTVLHTFCGVYNESMNGRSWIYKSTVIGSKVWHVVEPNGMVTVHDKKPDVYESPCKWVNNE